MIRRPGRSATARPTTTLRLSLMTPRSPSCTRP
jgi:hypothetical protein